jgi:hypothetical protein
MLAEPAVQVIKGVATTALKCNLVVPAVVATFAGELELINANCACDPPDDDGFKLVLLQLLVLIATVKRINAALVLIRFFKFFMISNFNISNHRA